MFRTFAFVLAALSALCAAGAVHAQAVDGRLKRILDSKSIAIAYRADATPFSFEDAAKQPIGFTIDLCKAVVKSIERQHKVQGGLAIKWVPVTVQTRFEAVAKGQADMECSSSTVTLSRLKQVDFSSYTFVESTGLIVRTVSGARSLDDLGNKTIAVVAGTSNERAVNDLADPTIPFAVQMNALDRQRRLVFGVELQAGGEQIHEGDVSVGLDDLLHRARVHFEPDVVGLPVRKIGIAHIFVRDWREQDQPGCGLAVVPLRERVRDELRQLRLERLDTFFSSE